MPWVSKSKTGWKCVWMEGDTRKEKNFSGEMSYTLAYRLLAEKQLELGIQEEAKNKILKNKKTRKLNEALRLTYGKIPVIKEPGIPLPENIRAFNSTGYGCISKTTSKKGVSNFVVTIGSDKDDRERICKWFSIAINGGEEKALEIAKAFRNEKLFEIQAEKEALLNKTLGMPLQFDGKPDE